MIARKANWAATRRLGSRRRALTAGWKIIGIDDIQRESGILDRLRHDIGKITIDPAILRQEAVDEFLIGGDVRRNDPNHVIDAAAHRIAGDDRFLSRDDRLKAPEVALAVTFQHDLDEKSGETSEPRRIDASAITRDDAAILEAAQALPACGRGKIGLFGKAQLGDAPVPLQDREDLQVDFIEFHDGARKNDRLLRRRPILYWVNFMPPHNFDQFGAPVESSRPLPATAEWRPSLPKRKGATKHKLLTDRIIADIDADVLSHGARMPTHRELARDLGVSVQTISISYKEAERRGYLRGEIGRGTFVRKRVTEQADRFMLDRSPGETADLSIVRAVYTEAHERASRHAMARLGGSDNSAFMRPCRPIAGLDRHRIAAQKWLRGLGLEPEVDRILITNGAAHGLFLAVAAIVRPGEVVLTESLTDHGIIGLATVLGFNLRALPTDGEGVLPDAFEAACAMGDVTALVLIPTLGNPTSHVAGAERRKAIAAIAARHRVFVIEDEVYKPLLAEPLPAIAQMLPDLGFFVTSFTKTVMTGLRVGYLVVPPAYSIRVASIMRVTSWSATNLPAEIAALWIENGVADALVRTQRQEAQARQAIVAQTLAGFIAATHPLSLCAWLLVPPLWTEQGLVRALSQRGVAVTPSDPFVVGERGAGGIRICLGGRLSHSALAETLKIVRATFEQLPPVFDVGAIAR